MARFGPSVTLVATEGDGSMDRYGRRLARHVRSAASLVVDLAGTSAGVMGARAASPRALRGLAGDVALVRGLRAARAPVHLASHHLARYGPLLGRAYIVTAHDTIRWHDVERGTGHISHPGPRDRFWTRRDYAGIAEASAVIAPSRFTRRELLERLRLPPRRVFVVPLGVDHERLGPVAQRPLEGRYVLFVGSEHPRKNLADLLGALVELRRERRFRDVRLVKIGEAGSDEAPYRAMTVAALHRLRLDGEVLFAGAVPDGELAAWYSGAAALVLPSRAEGFGLPPLEAMACGCPAIVSAAGALPEVAGNAALVVRAGDVDGLRDAIALVLEDAGARAELRRRGLERAARFTWERAARETERVYDAVFAESEVG